MHGRCTTHCAHEVYTLRVRIDSSSLKALGATEARLDARRVSWVELAPAVKSGAVAEGAKGNGVEAPCVLNKLNARPSYEGPTARGTRAV